jgi:hypothetical protein
LGHPAYCFFKIKNQLWVQLRFQRDWDAKGFCQEQCPGIKDFSELSLAKMTVLEAYQGAVNGATYGELVVGELKRPVSDIPYLADQDHHL